MKAQVYIFSCEAGVYIGVTSRPAKRRCQHGRKYGLLTWVILAEYENRGDALNEEKELIDTIGLQSLLNRLPGGGQGPDFFLGQRHSVETRRRMSEAQKGKKKPPLTEEARRNMSEAQKGKRATKETRRKLSEAHKGRIFTEEHRRNMSKAQMGNKHALGHRVTEEVKRKISESSKGKTISSEARLKMSLAHKGKKRGPRTEETKRKLSEALKGHLVSEESRRKMSLAQKGRKISKETRRKMSESAKKYWATKKNFVHHDRRTGNTYYAVVGQPMREV